MTTDNLSAIPTIKNTFRDIQQLLDQGGVVSRLLAGKKAAFDIPHTLIGDLIKKPEQAGRTLFHTLATTLTVPVALLCPEASLKIGSLLGIYERSKAQGLRRVWETVNTYSTGLWYKASTFLRDPNTLLLAKISVALGVAWTIFAGSKPIVSSPCVKELDTSFCPAETTLLANLGTMLAAPVSLTTGLTAFFGTCIATLGIGTLVYQVCQNRPRHHIPSSTPLTSHGFPSSTSGSPHSVEPSAPSKPLEGARSMASSSSSIAESRVEVGEGHLTEDDLKAAVDSSQAKEAALPKIQGKLARGLPFGHNISQADQERVIFQVMNDVKMREAVLRRLNRQIGKNLTADELNRCVEEAYRYYASGIAIETKEILCVPRASSSNAPPVDREMIEITEEVLASVVDSKVAQKVYKQVTIGSVKQYFVTRYGQFPHVDDSSNKEQASMPDREIVLARLRRVVGQLLTRTTLLKLVTAKYNDIGRAGLWEFWCQLLAPSRSLIDEEPQVFKNAIAELQSQGESGWYGWLCRCPDTNPALRLDINSVVADGQTYERNRPALRMLVGLHEISKRIEDQEGFVSIINGIVGDSGEITEMHLESIRRTIDEMLSESNRQTDVMIVDEDDDEFIRAMNQSRIDADIVNQQSEAQKAFVDELCAQHGWEVRKAVDDGDCLFASCFDEGGLTPEKLRQAVFEHMRGNDKAYLDDQTNVLMVEVDAIAQEADRHRRQTSLSKWPVDTRTAMEVLIELRAVEGNGSYETLRDAWLAGSAFYDYVKGMKVSKGYPGLLEVRVIAEVLQLPIQMFKLGSIPEPFVPAGSNMTCDDPNTINIVYDDVRKHFDRLVPRSSGQTSSSSS